MTKKRRRQVSRVERERQKRRQTLLVVVMGAAAVLAVVVLFVLSQLGASDGEPATATSVAGDVIETPAVAAPDVTEAATSVGSDASEAGSNLTAEGYPYLGSPDAPVKFIEYSDYFCGHCAGFALEKAPQIEEEYVTTGKVQYITQYYALGLDARLSVVEAGACAADQGRFFEYQRILFTNQQQLGATPIDQWQDLLVQYAQQVELDVATFEACWEQAPHQEQILASIEDARQRGVSGTPAFMINGQLVVGNQPYERFQAVIEEALAGVTQ